MVTIPGSCRLNMIGIYAHLDGMPVGKLVDRQESPYTGKQLGWRVGLCAFSCAPMTLPPLCGGTGVMILCKSRNISTERKRCSRQSGTRRYPCRPGGGTCHSSRARRCLPAGGRTRYCTSAFRPLPRVWDTPADYPPGGSTSKTCVDVPEDLSGSRQDVAVLDRVILHFSCGSLRAEYA